MFFALLMLTRRINPIREVRPLKEVVLDLYDHEKEENDALGGGLVGIHEYNIMGCHLSLRKELCTCSFRKDHVSDDPHWHRICFRSLEAMVTVSLCWLVSTMIMILH